MSAGRNSPLPANRQRRWFRAVALVGSLLITLLLAEGAIRLWHLLRYGTASGEINKIVKDPVSGLDIPEPGRDTGRIRIDSRGFRNDELAVPKPLGRIRVAFLGGSVAFCAEASSNEATWPHLVCQELKAAFPDADFDYVNAGIPGYTTDYAKRNLELRVRALEPDVIVYCEATNDLSKDTRRLAADAGVFDGGSADEPSALAKVSALCNWIEKKAKVRMRMRAAADGSNCLAFDERTIALGFRDRLMDLLRSAREIAPIVAVTTFAWQVRPDQPRARQLAACNTAFYYMPWMSVEGLLKAMGAYNRAIREAAAETGVALLDGEDEIPGDPTHFTDSVHLSDAGCRAQAERVAKRLIALPELRALVERNTRR